MAPQSHRPADMVVKKRIVDNRNRPAQPEPGEDPAVKRQPVRKGVIKRKPAKKK